MPQPTSLAGSGFGARVLVIEDEYLIAAMVADILADLGCTCVGPIRTHAEGVQAARSVVCDAAIINLVIEGQLAYEIATALAERQIPFCFASGIRQTDLAEEWRNRPFLLKPYTGEHVREFLLTVLPAAGG